MNLAIVKSLSTPPIEDTVAQLHDAANALLDGARRLRSVPLTDAVLADLQRQAGGIHRVAGDLRAAIARSPQPHKR